MEETLENLIIYLLSKILQFNHCNKAKKKKRVFISLQICVFMQSHILFPKCHVRVGPKSNDIALFLELKCVIDQQCLEQTSREHAFQAGTRIFVG